MSPCVHANEKSHYTEIDRLKSIGSSSSTSMGEITTLSNYSTEHQQTLITKRSPPESATMEFSPKLENGVSDKDDHEEKVPIRLLDEGNEFYRCVDPGPSLPPTYKSCNPNRRVRFPVNESHASPGEVPPSYVPAVNEVTIVSMKLEWLSPYEMSPSRNWRNCIMEINSTQLNFYQIDESLTAGIKHYSNGEMKEGHSHFLSLPTKHAYQFNKADQERITFNLKKNKRKFLPNNRIFKTYSLQFARLGVPTDYIKRTFVLRMRCESEQFLLNFAHVDDMIMWTMYLQIGIGVSLDLTLREYPNYRIVPRRRRRRRRRNTDTLFSSHNPDKSKRSNSTSVLQLGNISEQTPLPRRKKPIRSSSFGHLQVFGKNQNFASNMETLRSSTAPSSRKNPISSPPPPRQQQQISLKSKLKGLFKSKTDARISSPRKAAADKLQKNGLNSVIEDEEEETNGNVLRTKSLPEDEPVSLDNELNKENFPQLRKSALQNPPTKIQLPPNDPARFRFLQGSISLPSTPNEACLTPDTIHPELRNAHINHKELQEFREVVREHNEAEEADSALKSVEDGIIDPDLGADAEDDEEADENNEEEEEDDDDDEEEEEEEEGEDDDDENLPRLSSEQNRSIYVDEGIFHDSDDDYEYTMETRINYRNRASSTASALSNTPYGSDEVKWTPPIKQMSRRRYIRDSLRCIKPLSEGHRWVGKLVCRPCTAPSFETNNKPILAGSCDQNAGAGGSRTGPSWKNIDYKQTKNHYLKLFVAGPTGFWKTGTKLLDDGRNVTKNFLPF